MYDLHTNIVGRYYKIIYFTFTKYLIIRNKIIDVPTLFGIIFIYILIKNLQNNRP